ncbi:uncharacterized protein LY79DRAFT_574824 [Colletotrichum navitas]|uniref:Uncharacterized protein n=1 Tax=Colletotrichum navitas TaxID=681940 RepID=A0AAD8QEK1_9PEZI|nr:uncharacterized protein LY79DRAFT_574824 [Colletotrichum navitas]KAK1600536.1 hypothetical protein LY79DRAFT_574824 [Colletotrichum navitas]
MGQYLFETTDPVVELVWNIAIACFVFRMALSYFFLAFTTSVLFLWAIYKYQQQQQHGLTATQTELVLVSLQTVVSAVSARHAVVAHGLPRVPWFRLAVGGLAAAFLAGAEAFLWLALYGEGYGGHVWEVQMEDPTMGPRADVFRPFSNSELALSLGRDCEEKVDKAWKRSTRLP